MYCIFRKHEPQVPTTPQNTTDLNETQLLLSNVTLET